MAKGFYAVRRGRSPGVYLNWPAAEAQVKGFRGAEQRGFGSRAAAEQWLAEDSAAAAPSQASPPTPPPSSSSPPSSSVPPPSSSASVAGQRPSYRPSSRPLSSSAPSPPLAPAHPLYPRRPQPVQSLIYSLYCDGASRGNPGLSGCGGALYRPDGEPLCEYRHFLGERSTNNEAEYMGLIKGLFIAQRADVRHLRVRADSTLIVQQSKGDWAVHAEHLLPYVRQAQALLEAFDWWELQQIPREQNRAADRLSNEAIDQRSSDVVSWHRTVDEQTWGDAVRGDLAGAAAAVGGGGGGGGSGARSDTGAQSNALKRHAIAGLFAERIAPDSDDEQPGQPRRKKKTRYLPPGSRLGDL